MSLRVLQFMVFGLPLVVSVLGVPLLLRKVPPNRLYGIRTPETLASVDYWYQANQVLGVCLVVSGIASGLASALIWNLSSASPGSKGAICLCVTAILISAASIVPLLPRA